MTNEIAESCTPPNRHQDSTPYYCKSKSGSDPTDWPDHWRVLILLTSGAEKWGGEPPEPLKTRFITNCFLQLNVLT